MGGSQGMQLVAHYSHAGPVHLKLREDALNKFK